MKVLAACRRDTDDVRYLVKHLDLASADEVLALCREVFPEEEVPARAPCARGRVSRTLTRSPEVRSFTARSLSRLGQGLLRRHHGRVALTPCSDVRAAGWITAGDRPWHELVGFGPPGFPAYARLLFLPDPLYEGQRESDVEIDAESPSETEQLCTVLEVLSAHTRTPDDCYFCLWDGWGTDIDGGDGSRVADWRTGTLRRGPLIAPAFPPSVLNGPKVVLPNRAYFLFHGAVSDFGDWGAADMWPGQPRPQMPDPAFIWPADHAWCVANDVDPHWAGVGADVSAVGRLLADPRLDVVPADPREDQPSYR